jgi:hypothetical protein
MVLERGRRWHEVVDRWLVDAGRWAEGASRAEMFKSGKVQPDLITITG